MSVTQRVVPIWLALSCLPPLTAWGDAIVVSRAMSASTIAEILVDDRGIRVEFEVGFADLYAFRNLLPDAAYARLGDEPRPLAERVSLFFGQDWVIRDAQGNPLLGQLVQIVRRKRLLRDEITGKPLPVQPEDSEDVLLIELEYAWRERPALISIHPPLRDDSQSLAANIGFMAYHRGVPVNDFRYLGAESILDLDWDDPWYSRFRNKNLKRQYDAPLSVFLYVDHFEIRKEVVVRPKDLQQWIDLGLASGQKIPIEDQPAMKELVAEFLSDRGQVTVDGRSMQGTLDRIHFIRRSLRTTGVVDPPEPLDLDSATLGVIFVYPIDGLPKEVTVKWDLFGRKIQSVPAAATDEAGGLPSVLTPEDPTLVWTNFLTNPSRPKMMTVEPPKPTRFSFPVLSMICFAVGLLVAPVTFRRVKSGRGWLGWPAAAAVSAVILGLLSLPYAQASLPSPLAAKPQIQPHEARQLLHALLYNVYRSFDVRDESAVYDRLALSVSGDLLAEIYLQVRRSMELANQGGARVKIDDVEILDIAKLAKPENTGLAYRCRWNASGSVGHWGHIHRRTNQYDAVVTIDAVEERWTITAIDVREEQRIDPGASR